MVDIVQNFGSKPKTEESLAIQELVDDYLKKGGKITVVGTTRIAERVCNFKAAQKFREDRKQSAK